MLISSNQFYNCFSSDVDTVSLEFEAPPEALQASHLRMRPVKETQKHRRKQRKGTIIKSWYMCMHVRVHI